MSAQRDNFIYHLGGRFFLDNPGDTAEINGWGATGPTDDTISQDLGNVSAYPNLSRVAGGLVFPEDMRVLRMLVHHYDNNADGLRWGWVVTRLQRPVTTTTGSNTQTEVSIYSEIGNYRDYTNNTNQLTDIGPTDFTDNVLIAGEILNLAVAVDDSDTGDTNRYVQVMGGYIELEYVNGNSAIR